MLETYFGAIEKYFSPIFETESWEQTYEIYCYIITPIINADSLVGIIDPEPWKMTPKIKKR